jgi:hypothetical protein
MTLATLLEDVGLGSGDVVRVAIAPRDPSISLCCEWVLGASVNSRFSEAASIIVCLSLLVGVLLGDDADRDRRGITRDPNLILRHIGPDHMAALLSDATFDAFLRVITGAMGDPEWWRPTKAWHCVPAIATFHEFVRAVLLLGQDIESCDEEVGWSSFLSIVHSALEIQPSHVAGLWMANSHRFSMIKRVLSRAPSTKES